MNFVSPPGRVGRIAVDVLVVVVIGATVAFWVHASARMWFFSDDWWLAAQVIHPKGLLEPYNGNMSLVILVIYRVLLGVFGLSTYLPYRITAMATLGSVSAAMYFTTRGRIGRPLAIIAASVLLWPTLMDLSPSALNHYLTLAAGICCAYVLNQTPTRRQNLFLAVALICALSSASGGTTIALGCVVFCCCTRAPWRRWAAVLGPIALWGVWWLVLARGHGYGSRVTLGLVAKVRIVADSLWQSFPIFTGGHRWIAVVAIAALCIRAIQVLRRGIDESANLIAWLAAAAAWWVALVWQRGDYVRHNIFRYQLFSTALIILAVMPRRRIEWPNRDDRVPQKLAFAVGVAVPVLIVALLVGGNLRVARLNGRFLAVGSDQARQSAAIANIDPLLLPGDSPIAGFVPLHTVRTVMRTWGGVPTDPVAKQQAVLDMIVTKQVRPQRSHCATLPPLFERPRNTFILTLSAGQVPVRVRMTAGHGQMLPKVIIPAHGSVRFTFPLTAAGVRFEFATSPANAGVSGRSVATPLHASCMHG